MKSVGKPKTRMGVRWEVEILPKSMLSSFRTKVLRTRCGWHRNGEDAFLFLLKLSTSSL